MAVGSAPALAQNRPADIPVDLSKRRIPKVEITQCNTIVTGRDVYINLVPHNNAGTLGPAASLHASLDIPNITIVEGGQILAIRPNRSRGWFAFPQGLGVNASSRNPFLVMTIRSKLYDPRNPDQSLKSKDRVVSSSRAKLGGVSKVMK